jgi:very-short-patch-repair endonuclease
MDIHNRKYLETFRKNLRNNTTSAEGTLWNHLKQKQLGWKFRRQHSVGNFIIDFYCATERVAVELDGAAHFTEEGMRKDEERTKYLESLNIRVIRFENRRVFEDLEGVLREIRTTLTRDLRSESVPPEAGGIN